MPVAAIAAVAAAVAISKGASAIQQGNAEQANARNQASLHERNAQIADQNAATSWDLAFAKEEMVRRHGARVMGTQAAAMAQSGVDIGSGSALLVAHQSEANAELDALMVRHQGEIQAAGYTDQAQTERFAANVEQANARRARTAMYWNTFFNAPLAGATTFMAMSGAVQPTTSGYGTIDAQGAGYGLNGGAGPW